MTRIAVTKSGEEGAIHIDRLDGRVLTPGIERPQWAEGLAVAMLGERTGWYEQRLGAQLTDELRSPEMIDIGDLDWIGIDAEGDEMHLEHNGETRMQHLATLLDIDLEDGGKSLADRAIVQASVDDTYRTQPSTEETLEQAEGTTMQEIKQAVAG